VLRGVLKQTSDVVVLAVAGMSPLGAKVTGQRPMTREAGRYSGAYRGGECWAFVIECQRFNSMPADEPRAAKH